MKKIICLLAIFTLLIAIEVSAIEPTKDTKVSKAQPTTNFGSGRYTMVNDNRLGTDRVYIGVDLSQYSFNNVKLGQYVYWTGSLVVGDKIQAWYCPSIDFNEYTLTWNTQPVSWDVNGNPIVTIKKCYGIFCFYKSVIGNNGCSLVDSYTVTNKVIAGSPETKHNWDITSGIINDIDKKGTLVLKHDTENYYNTACRNCHYIQYLAREYPESAYRPKLVIS